MKDKILSVLRKHQITQPDPEFLADEIATALTDRENDETALVIVANRGIHAIDESRLPAGRVVYASQGNLDLSSADALKEQFERSIKSVAAELKGGYWRRVYLVPSGLPALLAFLTALVIQVTSKPPILLQYDRETGDYWPLDLEIRRLVSEV